MEKIVHIGRGEQGRIFCKIRLEDKPQGRALSITGVEGPLSNGDALGSCGQIVDGLTVREFAPGWDAALLERFLQVWRDWHLNDMRPGCEHQRANNWSKIPIYPDRPLSAYVAHPDGREGWNMLVWLPEKAGGLLSFPCPVCGYRYGTAWLFEPLPSDVVTFLQSLPDSTIKPVWV